MTDNSALYPHLYAILVAPPGVGKTKMIAKAHDMLSALSPDVHIGHSSLTAASLVDNLNEATRRHIRMNETPAVVTFNSLAIISNELGVLLPVYDTAFMNTLQDIYDCRPYSQKRRTKDLMIEIKNPQLNILAGTTPAFLQGTLPEGAWAEGFTARCLFIFSGEQVIASLFQERVENTALETALKQRLKRINQLYGEMKFTEEAARFIDAWHMNGREPQPDHPRLLHYNTRRTVNVLKLSMIASISENDELLIRKHHIERALEWLIEMEHYIPDIFKSMENTSHTQILKETWHFVYTTWMKEGHKPVAEARIIAFISKRTPAHFVNKVLEVLERGEYIKRSLGASGNEYTPRGRD